MCVFYLRDKPSNKTSIANFGFCINNVNHIYYIYIKNIYFFFTHLFLYKDILFRDIY